jgi:uncharacterized protein YlzI (FlbEa/FlbD family)
MITLTAVNNVRCSLRPELIADVSPGTPTAVILVNGFRLEVREPAAEVLRLLGQHRSASPVATESLTHGRSR